MSGGRRRGICRRLFLLAALAALLGLLARFMFVVRNVEIVGDTASLSTQSVVRTANVGLGASIFRVDVQGVESRVNSTGILCVESVRLRYPDTVEIRVRQRNRAAMLLHMGKIHVLDEDGCVVESLSQAPNADLIYISGMQIQGCAPGEAIRADEKQLEAYRTVLGAISSQGASGCISELKVDDVQDLRVITRTGVTVLLGDSQNMENKIAWLKSAVADLERRGEGGGTLDVRSGFRADYRAAS